MLPLPLLPRVHIVMLVHMTGVLYGSGMPPLAPPAPFAPPVPPLAHAAGGVPAATQVWNAATSAAVGCINGAGGIGIAAPGCMRVSATWATVFVLSVVAGAVSEE
jgi:hypothetical protein